MRLLIPNPTVCFVVLCCVPRLWAQIPDEAGAKVGEEWRRVKNATYEGDVNPVEVVHVGEKVKEYLKSAPLASQSRWWLQYELVDYTAARAWTNVGDYRKAYGHLVAEAATQQVRGVPFLHNTRNHDSFALDVFALHSAIMANTGDIAAIPQTGYTVFETSVHEGKPRFAFVFQPSGLEEYGVLVDNVDASEERWVIQVTKPVVSGGYTPASRIYVIAKRGHFSIKLSRSEEGTALVLGGISKFVEYIGDHVPVVRPSPRSDIALRIVGDDVEQPLQALNMPSVVKDPPQESLSGIANPDSPSAPEQSSQTPPDVQPKAPSVAKPLPTWLWPATAAVLLVGASLWLNRKKLKRA